MAKICPKCNKEWPDEFMVCPMDQTTLVAKPQQPSGFSLNLGDANAISGGVNMSDNHSVSNNTVNTSTSNVDSHNVITNNITQVEREKTPEELKHELELAYREECQKEYVNGILTLDGKRKLEDLQYRLGLSESSANKILSEVAKHSERKSTSLSVAHKATLNRIKKALGGNQKAQLNLFLSQMKAMVECYSIEEVEYIYYMLLAILYPDKCIQEYENHKEDKYWQTFWSSIAYCRVGNIDLSARLAADVDRKWSETMPQQNTLILYAINGLVNKDLEGAEVYYESISGDFSEYLSNVFECLYKILGNDIEDEEEQKWEDDKFYMENLFANAIALKTEQTRKQEEAEAKRLAEEERKKQEEAEARRLSEEERKKQEEAEVKRLAEEERKKQEEAEAKRLAEEERKKQEETEAKRLAEEQNAISATSFNLDQLNTYCDDFGYLRKLSNDEIVKVKSMLQAAPADNFKALCLLGQLYLQENSTAVNQKNAYDALKKASEHGVYEAAAYMSYFYLYGKVVPKDLDEAEQRMKIDDDYKKNPIFIKMLVDLYTDKGNDMLANVWKTKLKKFK